MPVTPTHPGVYVEELPSGIKPIEGVGTSITAFIGRTLRGPVNEPISIYSLHDYNRIFGGRRPKYSVSYAVRDYFLNGGSHAIIVRLRSGDDGTHLSDTQFIGAGLKREKMGLFALEKVDLFNLLCIPPYISATEALPSSMDRATDVTTNLLREAATYCLKRRAMLIIDPHSSWNDKDKAKDHFIKAKGSYPGISGESRKNAALYFPRFRWPEANRQKDEEGAVPCGAVAGIMARMDQNYGIWKAPAGKKASLVSPKQVSVSLSKADYKELTELNINCLRSFPDHVLIIWGARTLYGVDNPFSEWKYIPIRRTALFIEESLDRGMRWVVFEPNGEPLWAKIRLLVGAFMYDLFRQGAFQGTKPKEAYFVKCDSETTSQTDKNNGIVNFHVGFAPLKPAEFILLNITQSADRDRT